jgi:hypothetical protein
MQFNEQELFDLKNALTHRRLGIEYSLNHVMPDHLRVFYQGEHDRLGLLLARFVDPIS